MQGKKRTVINANRKKLTLEQLRNGIKSDDPAALANRPEPSPAVIPTGTDPTKVTFFGSFTTSSVTALADLDNDGSPEATERLVGSDNPATELISAFAASKTQPGIYYNAVYDAGGPNDLMSQIIVAQDAAGNFRASKLMNFSTGKGTVTALAPFRTPQGEALAVAKLFFAKDIDVITSTDFFTVTIYLPGANGIPDGSKTVELIKADPDLNFSFGGMTVDDNGNLYVNVATRTKAGTQLQIGGAILAFGDTDADGIPDAGTIFAEPTSADGNALTATTIIAQPNPAGGTQLIVLGGANELFGDKTQIAFFTDADGDLQADGDPTIFYTVLPQFRGYFLTIEDTSIAVASNLAFVNGIANYSFITTNPQGRISNTGIYQVKDNGSGVGGQAKTFFEPKDSDGNADIISFVAGVNAAADTVKPTVKVTKPNGGESVQGATQLAITFTSSDDKGVVSHDISLSTDSGATFPIVVASGVPGSAQTFMYLVPATIDTTNARIRVTAKDAAGNTGSDDSDANFSIAKPTTADTQAPVVTISSPATGAKLNGGSNATVNFTSTDNVGVATHNVLFSTDGVNFTALMSGLAGSANTFTFKVPSVNSQTAAIRVEAVDPSGNKGQATVSALNVVTDTTKPTVTVTSPKTKDKLKGGAMFNVTFTSMDDIGVASHEIQISNDGGATFAPLATGVPGNVQSFTVTIPNAKIKKGVIRVIARDAAGNAGMGDSGIFKVKPSK